MRITFYGTSFFYFYLELLLLCLCVGILFCDFVLCFNNDYSGLPIFIFYKDVY